MSKGWKITLIIIASIFVLIIGFLSVYFCWPWHKDFFNNASNEFLIPGLDSDFCPQGFTQIQDTNNYIISGYMDNGEPSRFYIINGETKEVERYFTLTINDKDYCEHAGGVLSMGQTLWTVSSNAEGGFIYRFSLPSIKTVENGAKVEIIDYFKVDNNADFIFGHDGIVWVGEFYRENSYNTVDRHHIKTRSGEINNAVVYGYQVDESKAYGLSKNSNGKIMPVKALSIRAQGQGMAVTNSGEFVLSTSYSLPDSQIYYYKNVLEEEAHSTISIGFTKVPLWFLDDEALIAKKSIPCMSEEIVINNDRVYILFESKAKKYRMFTRNRIDSVYSVALNYLKNS